MKKVLIITYYWPPSGGSGVQRWLFFTKYLREYGWEPIIFTADTSNFPALDKDLEDQIPEGVKVIRQSFWEPYTIYKVLTGRKTDSSLKPNVVNEKTKNSFAHDLSVWVRGNFFIPDARKFWIKPAVRLLLKFLNENDVDAIVSTSPPQSTHLIAMELKNKLGIPWIADFRDPWTGISYFDKLKLTKWAISKHKRLEKQVLHNADLVTTVSWKWQSDFKLLGGKENVEVITNGFDSKVDELDIISEKQQIVISHIGSLSIERNPKSLWKALNQVVYSPNFSHIDIRLRFIGNVDQSILQGLEYLGLKENVESIGYVPHSEVRDYMRASDVLLLIGIPDEKGVIPGKFFEYLTVGKPILSIGPVDSDVSSIISDLRVGLSTDYYEEDLSYSTLIEMLSNLGNYTHANADINKYHRRELTKRLSQCLNSIVE